MIQSLGLAPLRGELRHSRMGQWRHSVFFSAVGSPTRLSFDDGSRGCSEARLVEAQPPPRSTVKTAVASAKVTSGAALPRSAAWAGPRQSAPMPATPATGLVRPPEEQIRPIPYKQTTLLEPSVQRPDPSAAAPAATRPPRPAPVVRPPAVPPMAAPTPFGYYSEDQPAQGGRQRSKRRKAGRQAPRSDELEELRGLIQDLREELRALRRENELLRRAQVLDPWRGVPPQGMQAPQTPPRLQPLPTPQFSPVAPVAPVADAAMEVDVNNPTARLREPGGTPEAKRTPGVARALVGAAGDDV